MHSSHTELSVLVYSDAPKHEPSEQLGGSPLPEAVISDLNREALQFLAASSSLGGVPLLAAFALAQWLIYLVPAALVLLWIFGDRQDRGAAVAAAASGVLGLLLAGSVSTLWFHPRPFMVDAVRNYLGHPPDSSFPSDHATLFFALGVALLLRRPPSCPWLGTGFMLGGLAVGWARIFLGAHYPLDIAGAALIGAAAAILVQAPPGTRICSWLTGAAERVYGIVLPPRHHIVP